MPHDTAPVDLRSDTVTRPSPGMREAMAGARVGDDVYAEDPTVNELEALAAERTGKEAALFVPSGSMANLVAQLVHVRRGDEVICGQWSHCMRHEVGAGAAFAGAQYEVIPGNGLFAAEQAAERLRRPTPNTPGTALVWVENTHNLGGGLIFPLDEIRRLAALCREHGVPLHMDGARVFNAAIATGTPAAEIAAAADSLSFCLSKGLGAPVGSLLCGTRAFREQAHRFRKMLGGGMRQAGVLAAAGIFALRHNVERLAEDHANAKRLAAGLAGTPGLRIHAAGVQTNIVMASFEGDAAGLSARCGERGVLFHALGPHRLRFVTHLDVDATGIDRAVEVVRGESDAGVRA